MKLGTLLRTVRPMTAEQVWAQLLHRLRGGVRPLSHRGAPPSLALERPVAPFLPGAAQARWDGAEALTLLGRRVEMSAPWDWERAREGPLFVYHLHQFDYLRHPDVAPPRRSALVLDWIERVRDGRGWDPHPLGLRLLAWLKLRLTAGALPLTPDQDAALLRSLASQVRTLAANLEVHLQANHLLSNLLCAVCAGLALRGPAADRWLALEGRLRAQLAEQVLADGAHYERSPMYHSQLLEHVLDCVNLAAAGRRAPPALLAALRGAAGRMLGALAVWTHPDGRIALFSDSAFDMAAEPDALADYAAALGIAPEPPPTADLLHAAGYARLTAGPVSLLASLAGPMPAYQPGHAHCDALAFELCLERERVISDPGVCEYVAGPRRDWSRATRAHATLEIDGRDQAEVWAPHRVGGRPRVGWSDHRPGHGITGRCSGWATPDTTHERRFEVGAAGAVLRDRLLGRNRPVRMTLPFEAGVQLSLDGHSARVALASGRRLSVTLPPALRWRTQEQPSYPRFGEERSRSALVGEGSLDGEAITRFEILG